MSTIVHQSHRAGNAGRLSRIALAACVFLQQTATGSVFAQGLPTGGTVTSGAASVSTSGQAMTIRQTTPNAIINWNSFSIGQPNSVTFQQPGASSAILNRVTGNTPSTIAGQLNANGQVLLVNPNGIAITPTGTVNVGAGFIASTLNITDEDFKQGRHRFTGNGASAGVGNEGLITIGRGGYAALIGGTVANGGRIDVPLGKVGLASGERVTLDVAGDGFLQVAVPTKAGGEAALIEQKGRIAANGGRVQIEAATAREAARNAVNLSGVTQARTIGGRTGAIVIGGGDGGGVTVSGTVDAGGGRKGDGGRAAVSGDNVVVSGRIDASGRTGGQVAVSGSRAATVTGKVAATGSTGTGGTVTATAPQLALKGAAIDASGATGGGSVQLGGGLRGSGPLAHADSVTIDAASRIAADARSSGDGGGIVVWSDRATEFEGLITSRGGPASGNGGEVEVSSKGLLAFAGSVVLTAANGRSGTLLLDPRDLYIVDGATSGAAPVGWSVIDTAVLQTQLALGNVVLETGSGEGGLGNIALADGSRIAWASPGRLTLQADNSIVIGGTITAPRGSLGLYAPGSLTDTGAAIVSVAGVDAAAGYVSLAGAWRANGGTLNIAGHEAVLVSSTASLSSDGARGGSVSLMSDAGFVLVSGQVGARGLAGPGGTVSIAGAAATTFLGATIDASGTGGGGSIVLGGAKGAPMATQSLTFDTLSSARADSTGLGDGGAISLWSQGSASFHGRLSARGGPAGGSGGALEVSAASALTMAQGFAGSFDVTAAAPGHANGTLAIDPANIVIGDAMASFDVFRALLTSTGNGVSTGQPITGLASSSQFGVSAALNSTYALIGANGVSSFRGNAYLYNLSTGAWTDLSTTAGQPVTSLANNSSFGWSAALNSTYALIGARGVSSVRGNAYLYNLSTGAWTDLAATAGEPVTGLANNSQFGDSTALNSTYALIGAPGVSSNRGNAYLYDLSTGAWTDLAATAGQPVTGLASNSNFGDSTALNSTYALIGARGVSSGRGNAYLYDLSTGAWTDLATTAGQPVTGLASSSQFGISAALNSTYALIGALGVSSNRGNAYLYDLSTGAWTDLAATAGQPITGLASSSDFGRSAALNSTYALIGANGVSGNRGNAYLYDLSTGAWTDLAATAGQPVTGLASSSQFGISAALNSTYALIGANGVSSSRGNAYLYNLSTGAWTDLSSPGQPVTGLASNSLFGNSTALNSTHALIGAPGVSSNRGNAYLYNLSTGSWTDLAATAGQPVTGLAGDSNFGYSAALNSTHALIGAYGVSSLRGNAYLYNLSTGSWTDLAATSGQPVTGLANFSNFGISVALNSTYALIGARGVSSLRGNAYLYNLSTGSWTDLAATSGQPITGLAGNSNFGYSAALNSTYALIGAPGVSSNRGNAYLYNLSTETWTDLAATAGQPVTGLAGDSNFGISAALNSTHALIGAYGVSSNRGNAYLYNLLTEAWTDLAATPGEPVTGLASSSSFGWSAALNSTHALIGARGVSSSRGNAYLYNLSTGSWTDLATTAGQPVTGLASGSGFGWSVALNSTQALIGARGVSVSRGNAYLYDLSSGSWADLSSPGQPVTGLASDSFFGWSAALNSTHALIGAPGVSSSRGNAYLYNLSTGAWTDLAATAGQPVTGLASASSFGYSAALNDTYALIGARGVSGNRGNAYLYDLSTGSWTDLATTAGQPVTGLASSSIFGNSAALNSTHALIGAPGVSVSRGNAYLYNLSTGAWTDLATTAGQPITGLAGNSLFGYSTALSSTYALIGAYGVSSARGNAYLYNLSTGSWTNLATTAGQPVTGLANNSLFGYSTALNSTYALIGVPRVSGVRGNAYLYNLSTGAWTDLATTAGQPITGLASSSLFGTSTALNSTYALIGARGVSSDRGNAYLYNLSTGAWTDLAATAGQPVTGLASNSNFGYSAALNSTYALIGAQGVSSNRGNAWLVYLPAIVDGNGPITLVTPESIAASLQAGSLTLTADNDLSVQVPLGLTGIVTGSTLILQAGRSVAINAPIDFGSRTASLEANTPSAQLGASANRLAGAANLAVASGATITDTGGQLSFLLGTQAASGRDTTYGATGTLSIAASVTAGSVIESAPDAAIVNSAAIGATTAATVGGIAGSILINGNSVDLTGATLSPGGSRWLVFNSQTTSAGPTAVTLDASVAGFTRFSCTYGTACTNGAVVPASGNGLLYAWAPTLTVSGVGASGKVYDATVAATITGTASLGGVPSLGTLTADVTGVTLVTSGATASYDDKNVGTAKPITFSGYALSDGSLGYVLSQPAATTGTITAATLTAGLTGTVSKVYDTGTTASLAAGNYTLGTILGSDTVTVAATAASYDTKNVGTGKTVTATGLVLSGTDAGNYLLTSTTASAAVGTITPATLTAGLTGTVSKVYDATTAATLVAGNYTLGTILGSDTVTVAATAASYDTKNVGTGKTVTATGLVLSGTDAGNYVLGSTTASAAVGTVTAATLTAGLTGTVSKVYDAGTAASLAAGNYTLGTILGSDTVTVAATAASYDTKNVGTGKTVTATGLVLSGTDAGNYLLTSTTASAAVGTITPATLTAGLTGTVSKVYDATTAATLVAGNYTLGTILGSDTVTVAATAASYDTKNVGTGKTVTATGLVLSGTDAGNYVLGSTTASAAVGTITPATLTAGLTGTVSKVYDATTAATLVAGNYTLGTILGADTVTVAATAASYDTKNVGTGKTVTATGLTLSGTDAGNYLLTSTTASAAMGTITAATLTAGLTGTVSKVYDTGTGATLAAGNYTLGTVPGSDTVTVAATAASYDNKNVGTGKTVTATGLVLSGSDAGNYVLSSTTASAAVGTITPATLTAGLTGTVSKVYDATTAATLVAGNYTLGTILGSDTVTVAATAASYDSKNVGTGKTVTATGLVLSGTDAGNYLLTSTTASAAVGTVTAATLTAGLTGTVSKVYDAGTTASLAAGNYTLGTILGSDTVTVAATAAAYDSKNVGTGKTVTATGLVLLGTDAGNYLLTSTTASAAVGTITAATLTAGLTGTVSKVYDTGTGATLASGNYTLGTILGSDTVTVAATAASYDSKNVGTGKTVTATGLTLSGSDAGNYVLGSTTASAAVGTITPATLTAGLTGTVSKVYDATTAATLASGNYTLGTILGSDTVTVAATVASYDTKNVGTGKTVTATGLTLSGTDAGNYLLTSTTASAAMGTITPATLTAGLTGTVSKVYDTGTGATLASGNYTLGTILGSDTVTVAATAASYDTKNVGTGKTVTATGLTLSGTDAGNYLLSSTTASAAVGTITPATLTAGLTGTVSKVYDATTAATLAAGNYTLGTILGSDTVTVAATAASYDTKNVGTGKTVTATGLVLSGTDAGNYVLGSTTASAAVGTVTAATLTAGLTGTVSKVYDAGTAASLAAGNYTLGTILGSDTVTVAATAASYDTKNVGTGKTVTATGLTLSGTDAGNYLLTSTTASAAVGTITPATLTYRADEVSRMVGTANPVFTGTVTGFAGTETLADATTGQVVFSSPASTDSPAGRYAIYGSGLVALAGNYVFAQSPANTTAFIITAAASGQLPAAMAQVLSQALTTANVTIAIVDNTLSNFLNPAAAPRPLLLTTTASGGSSQDLTPSFGKAVMCLDRGCTAAITVE